jgi:membrane fusion protein (multidrug efflux system)
MPFSPFISRWLTAPAIIITIAGLAGCYSDAQEPAPGAMPPPAVSVYTVEPKDLPVSQEYVGYTAGSREVEIRARVSGILEQRLYQEGAVVEAGAPLFAIDPKPYEAKVAAAEAEVARAKARRDQTAREEERLQPLAKMKAASRKEYDDAISDAAFARADLQAVQAALLDTQLNLGYTRVNAPIAGITGQAQMVEGALVAAGESLLTTLVQTDPIYVHFSVSENDWLAQQQDVAAGELTMPVDAEAEIQVKLANGQLLDRVGHITFRDAHIDAATGSVAMRADLPNADGMLKAGQFVRVVVNGAVRPDAISVPQRAVLEGPQGKFVYVVAKDDNGMNVAQARPVEAGEWITRGAGADAEQWVIRTGLAAGDQVILDNLIKIRPGAPVQPAAATASAADTVAQSDNN